MYEVGQLIVYGASGVCRVEALEHPSFAPKEMKDRLYYRLKPLYEQGTLYAPVDTTVPMRPVLTRQQAEELLAAIPQLEPDLCASHSPQLLSEHYKKFFQSGLCEDLLRLVKTIQVKARRTAGGRAMSKTDQHFMKKAEEQLYRELAVALECTEGEARNCTTQALDSCLAAAQ